MNVKNVQGWLIVGGVAIAAYVLWKAKDRLSNLGDKAGDGIASLYLRATTEPVVIKDAVKMPSGEIVTFNQIVTAGSKVDSKLQFVWKGQRWQLTTRTSSGMYGATRVG